MSTSLKETIKARIWIVEYRLSNQQWWYDENPQFPSREYDEGKLEGYKEALKLIKEYESYE